MGDVKEQPSADHDGGRPAIARAPAIHDCSLREASGAEAHVPTRWQRGRCGRVTA